VKSVRLPPPPPPHKPTYPCPPFYPNADFFFTPPLPGLLERLLPCFPPLFILIHVCGIVLPPGSMQQPKKAPPPSLPYQHPLNPPPSLLRDKSIFCPLRFKWECRVARLPPSNFFLSLLCVVGRPYMDSFGRYECSQESIEIPCGHFAFC